MSQSTNRPARRKPERSARLIRLMTGEVVLQITLVHRGPKIGIRHETFRYRLREVVCDYGRGFELWKISEEEGETYHIHFDAQTGSTCDCRGAIKHGHCKHLESLRALEEAGRLTGLPFVPTAPVPTPATAAAPAA